MGLVFGIFAIVFGVLAAWLGGWIGVIIVAILAALAIVLTITKNKSLPEEMPKKKAGIVCGIVGVCLVLLMQGALIAVANKLNQAAKEAEAQGYGSFPIFAEFTDDLKFGGFIGLGAKITKQGYNSEMASKEIDNLNNYLNDHPLK